MNHLADFVKQRRKEVNLTQRICRKNRSCTTVIRKIEQGKTNLNLEKVNQVLPCLAMNRPGACRNL